ncbi:MAG: adenylate/guanylate cyclase domain-containing protein [Rhodomicrobium sp.]
MSKVTSPAKALISLGRTLSIARLGGIVAVAAFALLRLWDPAPIELVRNFYFDLLQRAHPNAASGYPVIIVDIDDKSLGEIGQWPWPRTVLTKLTSLLAEEGAAVIGFDIIFAESDRLSPKSLAASLEQGDDNLRRELATLPDNDEIFAQSLKSAPAVLGRASLPKAAEGAPAPTSALRKVSIATIGGDPSGALLRYPAALKNLPSLEAAASGIAMLTVLPERDGLIRRAPLVLSAGNEIVPGMAVELIRTAAKASSILIKRDAAGVRSVVLAGVEIPADRDGQLWVSFTRHDPKRYVSAADVLAGRINSERITGKIVLIGTSAAGLFDLKSTPLDRVIPGVEIHAQIAESILGGTTLNRPNFALGLEVSLALAVGALLVILAPLSSALVNLLIGGVIAGVLTLGSWYLFDFDRLLIDVSYPLASSFAAFLLLTFMNYAREERRRTQVRAAFRQYLSPELVEQLIREPDRLVLGGETREMTILFSDVRGFTSIAESFKDNPAQLTALMNRMLTSLSLPIIARKGTIDKYIGDAIMAFWNAPLDDPNHALNACQAALELLQRLDSLNEERRLEALRAGTSVRDMEIGLGISTGLSVVGNMGSDMRFDYSVMGDSVNLASRLESLTSLYGLRILLASETARLCRGKLALIEVDRVRVKGKQDAETIYTVLGGLELASKEQFLVLRDSFSSMLANYRARAWQQALGDLRRCMDMESFSYLNTLFEIYIARINAYLGGPPPPDWDGVFNARF